MQEVRIELLQRMPIFGGIRADTLQFLLAIVSVPMNEFFFRESQQGDSMFVLEKGKATVLKSWHGQDCLLQTLKEGDCFGEMAVMDHSLRETGEDLPSPNAGKWVRIRSAELDSDFLRQLPVDATMLLRDIVGRGHHVTSQLDQSFLPSAHR
jgi:CRP-like cAMP-binding protein